MNFDFWLVLCLAVFFCYFVLFLVVTLPFALFRLLFVFCNQLFNKARLLFVPLSSPPVCTAFGSSFPFHSFPLFYPDLTLILCVLAHCNGLLGDFKWNRGIVITIGFTISPEACELESVVWRGDVTAIAYFCLL